MEAVAILALADAQNCLRTAEVACAMSIEGLMGSHVPLDARIHRRRGQYGQQISAERLRKLVSKSEINVSHDFLRLELGLAVEHHTAPCNCLSCNTKRKIGIPSEENVLNKEKSS